MKHKEKAGTLPQMNLKSENSDFNQSISGKELVDYLDSLYPKISTHLVHNGPFQLLIATILSAQCTDVQVNKVTPALFQTFPDPYFMAGARIRTLVHYVKSTGFYNVKARRLKQVSKMIVDVFGGRVPDKMEDLLTLPGVGRKTANIVLSAGYGKIEGIAVDTHVFRLSRRIGLSNAMTPEKMEIDLMRITPKQLWPRLSMLLIFHGRQICHARNPLCGQCVLSAHCEYYKQKLKDNF